MDDAIIAKPLQELIDETANHMKESGYAEGTINCYKVIWNKLIRYSPIHDYDRKVS